MNRAEWLALSDERELYDKLRQAAWYEGYAIGARNGWTEGYDAAEADMAAAWHSVAEPIAHPGRSETRGLTAALAAQRRDTDDSYRQFANRAAATPVANLTDAQAGMLCLGNPAGLAPLLAEREQLRKAPELTQ